MSAFDIGPDDLPPTVPIFPLSGVLLLPRGRLPLNIFEPRYLAMTDDVLRSERLIGMIQPTRDESEMHEPPIYQTGCVGRMIRYEEADDGRYLILLKGVCRFDVIEEVPTTRGYRRARIDWSPYLADFEPGAADGFDRDRLIDSLVAYFEAHGLKADWNAISDTSDEALITSLAMLCPFDAAEKQALIEAKGLTERAQVLTALIEMGAYSDDDSTPSPQ